ncbi:hypothetical protein AGMMS49975_08040 [Clostridia bacterium]|nr:hypothetical protein AGMMS49975_08040 [Clostridia bacterium]
MASHNAVSKSDKGEQARNYFTKCESTLKNLEHDDRGITTDHYFAYVAQAISYLKDKGYVLIWKRNGFSE